jgi:excisionase family DNA binding protein
MIGADSLTVPEAARRARRNAETIRRWIREGRLRAQKVGTQHLVDPADLEQLLAPDALPVPAAWQRTPSGAPMPDVVAAVRRSRSGH